MNLAIEYLLRNKRARSLLSLPCSLFLTTASGHKLVVGIQPSYGDNECLLVKHWKLWETSKEDRLPPFLEFKINKQDVFTSSVVILDHCSILDYEEEPFECGGKQYADFPHSAQQELEYKTALDRSYNTQAHQARRLNWLWTAFEQIYVPEDLRFHYGNDTRDKLQLQREIVHFYSKPIWMTWVHWKKYILDMPGAASELVFRREYVRKESTQPKPTAWRRQEFNIPTNYQGLGAGIVNN